MCVCAYPLPEDLLKQLVAVKPPDAWKTSSPAIAATKSECASCMPGCLGPLFHCAGATALGKLHLVSLGAPEEGE